MCLYVLAGVSRRHEKCGCQSWQDRTNWVPGAAILAGQEQWFGRVCQASQPVWNMKNFIGWFGDDEGFHELHTNIIITNRVAIELPRKL